MPELSPLSDPRKFGEALYRAMQPLHPGVAELELYEFRYALDNLTPPQGWDGVELAPTEALEAQVRQADFFEAVRLKPMKDGRIVLDEGIVRLTRMLFAGLVSGRYPPEWIREHFYFDLRGFIFFVRTHYYTPEILEHFGGRPARQFEARQKLLEGCQDLGYREVREANREVDAAFIDTLMQLLRRRGVPLLLTLVGPSAAGKTEITARIQREFAAQGRRITSVEMDHFFKDREYRDGRPMDCGVIHFDLFRSSLQTLLQGRAARIPRYDFFLATSSHDLEGRLRPGREMLEVEPADVILLEGNFPFHLPEIASLAGLKIVYLADDAVRLKRKWRRDIDYRKKYDPFYLCNRYFRTQFLRAREVYWPMMQVCDVLVDTSAAALWLTPQIAADLTEDHPA